MKKGSRVFVFTNGSKISLARKGGFTERHGTLLGQRSGNGRIRFDDDRQYSYKIPLKYLNHSTKPDPAILAVDAEDLGAMAAYEVRGYQEHRGLSEETIAFDAKVYKGGKLLCHAANRGCGGCNEYSGNWDAVRQFQDDAKALMVAKGDSTPFEADGYWINWYATERPEGITFRQSVAEYLDNPLVTKARK